MQILEIWWQGLSEEDKATLQELVYEQTEEVVVPEILQAASSAEGL